MHTHGACLSVRWTMPLSESYFPTLDQEEPISSMWLSRLALKEV